MSLVNISGQCRICRKTALNAKRLFEVEQAVLVLQIESFTGEWLRNEEGWPVHICNHCENDLNIAVAFRERCIQSQQKLRLELVAAEAKSDHMDPLNIVKITDAQNELIIKDKGLDECPAQILEHNSVQLVEIERDIENNKHNEIQEWREEGVLQKPIEEIKFEMCAANAEDKTNQVEKLELAVSQETIEISSSQNEESKIKASLAAAKRLKEIKIKKTRADFLCDTCNEHFEYKCRLERHKLSKKHKSKEDLENKITQGLSFDVVRLVYYNYHLGKSVHELALMFAVTRKTIYKILNRGKKEGKLQPNNGGGLKLIINDHAERIMIRKLNRNSHVSIEELTKEEHDMDVSHEAVHAGNENDKQDEIQDGQKKGVLQKPLQEIEHEMLEMNAEDMTNEVEKSKVPLTPQTIEELNQNEKPKKISNLDVAERIEKLNLEKPMAVYLCDTCNEYFKYKYLLERHKLSKKHKRREESEKKISQRLSMEVVRLIHYNYHLGKSALELAVMFAVTPKAIFDILNRRNECRLQSIRGGCFSPKITDHSERIRIRRLNQYQHFSTRELAGELKEVHGKNVSHETIQRACAKSSEIYLENENDEENETQDQEEDGVLQKPLKDIDYEMLNMVAENETNEVEKMELAITSKTTEVSIENEKPKIKLNVTASKHLKKIHLEEPGAEFVCDRCGKLFKYESHLNVHLLHHTDGKDLECRSCNKKYSCHAKLHTNERNYRCEICDKSFALLTKLKAHKLTKNHKKREDCELYKRMRMNRNQVVLVL